MSQTFNPSGPSFIGPGGQTFMGGEVPPPASGQPPIFERAAAAHLAALPLGGSPFGPINVAYLRLGQRPQLPALVFLADKQSLTNHDGPAGLAEVELRLTVFSEDLAEAVEIAELLRLDMQGFNGDWHGVRIQCHGFQRFPPLIEPPPVSGHPGLYQVPCIARMFVSEATS